MTSPPSWVIPPFSVLALRYVRSAPTENHVARGFVRGGGVGRVEIADGGDFAGGDVDTDVFVVEVADQRVVGGIEGAAGDERERVRVTADFFGNLAARGRVRIDFDEPTVERGPVNLTVAVHRDVADLVVERVRGEAGKVADLFERFAVGLEQEQGLARVHVDRADGARVHDGRRRGILFDGGRSRVGCGRVVFADDEGGRGGLVAGRARHEGDRAGESGESEA